jgi:hypothetical protein
MRIRGLAAVLMLLLLAVAGGEASADVWDRLTSLGAARDAKATETFEDVVRHIGSLADGERTPIAAAATEVGHWRLANRAGELFTAAGRNELAQALRTLVPDREGKPEKLHIHLTPDSLFRHGNSLAELPATAALSIVIDGRALPIRRAGEGGIPKYQVLVGPRLYVEAGDRALFDEVAWQFRRPLLRAQVRTLALEPGGLTVVSRTPQVDPGTRRAQPDAVDPGHAGRALQSLGGQLVLLTGRLNGDRFAYKPASGAEGSIGLADLWSAAAQADANLIAIAASSPRQPGSRNWLWQRIGVSSVDKALGAGSLGEFLHVLAGEPSDLVVKGERLSGDRVELEVTFRGDTGSAPVASITQAVKGTWSDIVSETAGSLTILGMKASLTRSTRQAELDRRLVPFIPSAIQIGYLALMAAGLFALPVLGAWWRRIWPEEEAAEYGSAVALFLARAARWAAFAALFVPLAALAALVMRLAGGAAGPKSRQRAEHRGNLSPG